MLAILLLTCALGGVAGLRSLTAPAVVCWAAHFGWLHVSGSRFAFIETGPALAIVTVLAGLELIVDKLPKTPPRTAPVGLLARIVTGGACGAAIATSVGIGVAFPAVVALIGAVFGALAGYRIRRSLVSGRHLPAFGVAVAEDLIAIVGGLLIVSHV